MKNNASTPSPATATAQAPAVAPATASVEANPATKPFTTFGPWQKQRLRNHAIAQAAAERIASPLSDPPTTPNASPNLTPAEAADLMNLLNNYQLNPHQAHRSNLISDSALAATCSDLEQSRAVLRRIIAPQQASA